MERDQVLAASSRVHPERGHTRELDAGQAIGRDPIGGGRCRPIHVNGVFPGTGIDHQPIAAGHVDQLGVQVQVAAQDPGHALLGAIGRVGGDGHVVGGGGHQEHRVAAAWPLAVDLHGVVERGRIDRELVVARQPVELQVGDRGVGLHLDVNAGRRGQVHVPVTGPGLVDEELVIELGAVVHQLAASSTGNRHRASGAQVLKPDRQQGTHGHRALVDAAPRRVNDGSPGRIHYGEVIVAPTAVVYEVLRIYQVDGGKCNAVEYERSRVRTGRREFSGVGSGCGEHYLVAGGGLAGVDGYRHAPESVYDDGDVVVAASGLDIESGLILEVQRRPVIGGHGELLNPGRDDGHHVVLFGERILTKRDAAARPDGSSDRDVLDILIGHRRIGAHHEEAVVYVCAQADLNSTRARV